MVEHLPDQAVAPADIPLDRGRGLAIIDVDEVLALFIQGFDRFLRPRGFEFRMVNYGLFNNIYPLGGADPTPMESGRALFDDFFAVGCGALEPAPGAADGLARLSKLAQIVILTNAPEPARRLRGEWLKRHGMDYPLLLSTGPKGPIVARLAERVEAPVMFVDDLIPNHDSVADAAPKVVRIHMIADPELRRIAPSDPERHRRIDDWDELVEVAKGVFAA